jgi:signal transduction histidine kinase
VRWKTCVLFGWISYKSCAYPKPSADSNAFSVVIVVVVVVVAVVLLLLLFVATRRVASTVHRDPPIEVIQFKKENQNSVDISLDIRG